MDLSQYAELFLAESREHLSACNQLLLEWERTPTNPAPVGGLFRAVHTVKGMAATMGYGRVTDLAHRMENLLDLLRRGGRPATDELLQLLFQARDALEHAVELSVVGREEELDIAEVVADLDGAAVRLAGPGAHPAPSPTSPPPVEAPRAAGRLVQITLRPEAPLKGGRALLVLKQAERLGSVTHVTPPVTAFEADEFDGRFSLRLASAASGAEIEQAVRRAGDVEHVAVGAETARALAAPGSAVAPGVPGAAGAGGAPAPPSAEGGKSRHIRVDLRRLDGLMDLIGELVTTRGRLNQLAVERRDPAIDDLAIQVSRLSADLQAEIIQARMTAVWQVFDRFPRLVRDLARELGKHVVFRVEGKEIELDRAILDELGDPLLHLLRNAVDHGIEPPAERQRRGKPADGEIVLTAVRERASVAISVADDGRGIDRTKILERARRDNVVDAHAEVLSDDQLLRVLARPGFSTADAVTSVSGRGVGIDVVMTRIRALGGTIDVRSEQGKGTTFVLRLPVTLAIVRALIAGVGEERYALPLTYVAETVEFGAQTTTTVEGREAIVLHERVVPLVHLRRLLGVAGDAPPRAPVIVLEMGERRTGIVVDGMLGQHEIVVKGFDAPHGTLPVFSGATIMGDGIPALILDAGGLV
ncbi:MAG TPA: chemotaxis protein CheA [Gemmatimonadales bacterium]|jgi:two-component system chemotaxis sensor kinase CheA|nr:chemotaxis protein CheA [Gemmatimonadales bacterium]